MGSAVRCKCAIVPLKLHQNPSQRLSPKNNEGLFSVALSCLSDADRRPA
jgi:hypothetical protein